MGCQARTTLFIAIYPLKRAPPMGRESHKPNRKGEERESRAEKETHGKGNLSLSLLLLHALNPTQTSASKASPPTTPPTIAPIVEPDMVDEEADAALPEEPPEEESEEGRAEETAAAAAVTMEEDELAAAVVEVDTEADEDAVDAEEDAEEDDILKKVRRIGGRTG